jgi:hypothetical protein
MRTTIDIDEALLGQLKERAARTGRTMASLVEDAVRAMLARGADGPKPRRRITLPTFAGKGPQPGIDPWDSAALLDAMEEKRR